MATDNNIQSQMRKGFLEYCILLIISKAPSYSSDIILQLKNAKMIVVEGTLYPILTRLKNSGLLQYQWEESTQGPPRKYYALSPEGSEFLATLEQSWLELKNVVDHVKTQNEPSANH